MTDYDFIDGGDVLVIGAGLAGLYTALCLTQGPGPVPRVSLLSMDAPGRQTASAWAQGGIAAAVGPDDTPAHHERDTIAAGAGIVDPAAASLVSREIGVRIDDLARLGVPFDREVSGAFVLGREAAHGRNRIVKITGDQAGAAITFTLADRAAERDTIRILSTLTAFELAEDDGGRIRGVFAVHGETGETVHVGARAVVLATGGTASLYAVSTPALSLTGSGLGMAARAGASIADPEFVQFHPTAMMLGQDPAPLATEALRGEGASLVTQTGEAVMRGVHDDGDLAPRDVVARAVFNRIAQGDTVYLDCRTAIGASFSTRFPTVYRLCTEAGLDPAVTPIPVAPAAHYHMGGVATDLDGRTSRNGLWACGEVACTGLHGANRLASNSLAEALVMGGRVADALRSDTLSRLAPRPVRRGPAHPGSAIHAAPGRSTAIGMLRRTMTDCVGLIRTEDTLREAADTIARLEGAMGRGLAKDATLLNILAAAGLIVSGAHARRESRGSHFRTDYPVSKPEFARRTVLTLSNARAHLARLGARDAAPEEARR